MLDSHIGTLPVLVARSQDESPATDDAIERRRIQRNRFATHGAVVATKLLQMAAGPHHTPFAELTVTASVGVALYPDHGEDVVTLVVNADTAMYEAKRSGRGQCRVSTALTPIENPPAK